MSGKIEIILNGEKRTLARCFSFEELVRDLGLKSEQIAIEVNGQIVSRKRWSQETIGQGDRVEIVHFVGGGR